MATTETRLKDLAQRAGTNDKAIKMLINGNAADLAALATTDKTTVVAALNELKTRVDNAVAAAGATIDDTTASTSKTYSSSKINSSISTAVTNAINAVTNGAGTALDTLKELADALGNDPNFAATVTSGLANRVRFDAAQTLTAAQKAQAKANIDAYGALELGNPDVDLVAIFNNALI